MFFFNFWSHFLLTYNMWIKKKNILYVKKKKKKKEFQLKIKYYFLM